MVNNPDLQTVTLDGAVYYTDLPALQQAAMVEYPCYLLSPILRTDVKAYTQLMRLKCTTDAEYPAELQSFDGIADAVAGGELDCAHPGNVGTHHSQGSGTILRL